ncbi:unnamed protein product [Protopolystoma xenopodis]|uniref:Uncharacterized protein n=1 Tax=Protopolystoma xenopodis TaxID=117903 RepID=A0A3S5AAB8_9PLAT|nr:unnamed protein product [Protopolystoma xenopodis]
MLCIFYSFYVKNENIAYGNRLFFTTSSSTGSVRLGTFIWPPSHCLKGNNSSTSSHFSSSTRPAYSFPEPGAEADAGLYLADESDEDDTEPIEVKTDEDYHYREVTPGGQSNVEIELCEQEGVSLSALQCSPKLASSCHRRSGRSERRHQKLRLLPHFLELPNAWRDATGPVAMATTVPSTGFLESIDSLHSTEPAHLWLGTVGGGYCHCLDMRQLRFITR